MTAMTFLTIPDGTLGYRDSGATGTLAATSPTYAASSWAGHQGAVIGASTNITLASVATAANPAKGAAIVRCTTPPTTTGYRVILAIGAGVNLNMRLRLEATTNEIKLAGSAGSGNSFVVGSGVKPAAGATITAYCAWNGTALAVAVDTGATTAGTAAGAVFNTSSLLALGYPSTFGDTSLAGGRVDGVAIFDAPLTDAQRLYLAGLTTPWTWGMALSAPIAGYIDVLPSPGANTGAPTLTLP